MKKKSEETKVSSCLSIIIKKKIKKKKLAMKLLSKVTAHVHFFISFNYGLFREIRPVMPQFD